MMLRRMMMMASGSGGGGSDSVITALFASGEQGIWLDPSDFSTMYQDSSGTTPVTSVGQYVGKILDKSGRGNHAIQSSSGSRPLLQQDGSGNYYLQFDGTDDSLQASIDLSGTDKVSIFTGTYKVDDTARIVFEFTPNWNAISGSFILVSGSDSGFLMYSGSTGSASSSISQISGNSISAPNISVITTTHNISGDLTTFRRNGVDSTSSSGDKGFGNFQSNILYIGARSGSSVFFNGRIYGLIVRGSLSTSTEINDVESWMNSKTNAY